MMLGQIAESRADKGKCDGEVDIHSWAMSLHSRASQRRHRNKAVPELAVRQLAGSRSLWTENGNIPRGPGMTTATGALDLF